MIEVVEILRLERDLDLVILQIENRIRTQHEFGKFYEKVIEHGGNHAFAISQVNVLEIKGRLAKPLFYRVKTFLENLRYAGKNVDIANIHDRRE